MVPRRASLPVCALPNERCLSKMDSDPAVVRIQMSAASSSPDVKTRGGHTPGVLIGRLPGIVLVLIGLAVIAVLTPRVARVYPVSSDDATGILEADAVLRGNVLLRGWTLSNVSFTTTDLPFYVAGVALNGMRPSLLRDVPVAVYMAAVGVAAVLARGPGRKRGGRPVLGMAALVVLLCLPAGGLAEIVTKGYIRVGTTLLLFAAMLALDAREGQRIGPARIALFAILMTLSLVADSFALVIGVLPVLIVCGLGAFSRFRDRAAAGEANVTAARRAPRPPGELNLWAVSLAAMGSVAAVRGLSWLIEVLGGYRVVQPGLLQFLAHRNTPWIVSRNVLALGENLSMLYRSGFPVEFTTYSVAVSLACLMGPLFVCIAFLRGSPRLFRGPRSGGAGEVDFVGNVLWFSMALCVAAYLASSIPKDRTTARYMVPFLLSCAVLTGRVLADRIRDTRVAVPGLVLLGIAYAFTVWDDLQRPAAVDHAVELANALAENGLHHGYGPFWDASIVTASSGGQVAVRPIFARAISPERHAIVPLQWMADARWFTDEPGTFVVLERDPAAAYQFGVDEWICTATFGPTTSRHKIGPYVVLTWDHDLRAQIGLEVDVAAALESGRNAHPEKTPSEGRE